MTKNNAVRKPSWRDYLNGTYKPNVEKDMRFKVRAAAKRAMADLLLILNKADKRDLLLIFHESKNRDKLVLPLFKKFILMNYNLEREKTQEDKDMQVLLGWMRDFDKTGVSYNKLRLLRSGRNFTELTKGAKGGRYLKQKITEYLIKTGLSKKDARKWIKLHFREVKDSTVKDVEQMRIPRETYEK